MNIGPEDPRPFVELAATLGLDRIPWRAAIVIEGCGQSAMQIKDVGASFLSMFPGNNDLRRAFAFLKQAREDENHISIKLRASFATWASVEDGPRLRRRVSTLGQRIEGWGNCKSTMVIGDPLEGVMSSAARSGSGLHGEPVFGSPRRRARDAALEPHGIDPGSRAPCCSAGLMAASGHTTLQADVSAPLVVDIFVAPPGSGKVGPCEHHQHRPVPVTRR